MPSISNILNLVPKFNTHIPIFIPAAYENSCSNCFNKLKIGCLASYVHPNSYKYFKSVSAINKERKRHYEDYQWWIIHPFSIIRFYWEILMTIILAISLISIPFMTSFVVFDYETIQLDRISIFLYIFFWLDILMNFVSGVYKKKGKQVILLHSEICKNYLLGFFVVDVLTSLPYDHLTYYSRQLPGTTSSIFVALINIIPILKIARYVTFYFYVGQLLDVPYHICRIIKILMISFYIISWITCIFYLTTVLLMYIKQVSVKDCDCWLADIKNGTISVRSKTAFFIILQNFMISGFDIVELEYTIHTIICTFMMIMGIVFEVYIIIMFLEIYTNKNASEASYEETVNQIHAYARQKQMDRHIAKRLEAYYYYRFKNYYFREKKILSILSNSLREEIALHSCHHLVMLVDVFQDIPQDIIASIVARLKFEIYLPDDVIIKAGHYGDCMFFLEYGSVAVFTPTGHEICHLEEGSYFGEVALLAQDQRRITTVIAIEVCQVYRLDWQDFRKYVSVHTELFKRIERIAITRIEKTILTDEQDQVVS